MNRSIFNSIQEFLSKKMVLLMGPRQVGKTTLAKSLCLDYAYYNYDIKKDLKVFRDPLPSGLFLETKISGYVDYWGFPAAAVRGTFPTNGLTV